MCSLRCNGENYRFHETQDDFNCEKKKNTFEMFIIVRPRISVLYIYGKFENEYDNFQNIRRMENGGARYYI